MKVYRQVKMSVEHFEIGDSINIKLKGIGKFEATVQKVYEDGHLYILREGEKFTVSGTKVE